MNIRPRLTGFSLIEMAFVLVIVTLLLGGLLVPFTTQIDQKRIAETQKQLDEIKEALIGYALSHTSTGATPQPFLPCPDATTTPVPGGGIPNDGHEDRTPAGGCAFPQGNLPWVDLGVGRSDAWGNHFSYRVADVNFADSSVGFGLASGGNINVCTALNNCPPSNSIATNLPALVLSFGKNGYGGINVNRVAGVTTTNPCPGGGCGADETQNMNMVTIFISHTMTPSTYVWGEFDDIVTWLSPNVLFNRMVAAGRLP